MASDMDPIVIDPPDFNQASAWAECRGYGDRVDALRARVEELEREIGHIDSILARRPALADCPTRAAKIERAINVAKNADRLTAERDEARADMVTLADRLEATMDSLPIPNWRHAAHPETMAAINRANALPALTRHAENGGE